MKTIIAIILILFSTSAYTADERYVIYHLLGVFDNSGLNCELVDNPEHRRNLDGDRKLLLELFRPTKGDHKVLVFMAPLWGVGADERQKIFHDLLILKTDANNTILDGFQYTLEYAELPFSYDLFRVKSKGIKLEKGLKLSHIEFRSLYDNDQYPIGILDNVYNLKQRF